MVEAIFCQFPLYCFLYIGGLHKIILITKSGSAFPAYTLQVSLVHQNSPKVSSDAGI